MDIALKLPIGIEDFREIRRQGFYYIDKTKLIEQLLDNWGKVNLFTRPRRFGKTLNMSMLRYFFEVGADKTLFEGLYISKNRQFCEAYMGKFPVVFLTLKGVEGTTFEEARLSLAELITAEARRFKFLMESDKLDNDDKEMYRELLSLNKEQSPVSLVKLRFSLKNLSELLYKHYGQKTIVLIDEYDVPLDKAFQAGYYKEMVTLIRGLLGETLKTNDFLQFAVLTGCLRVSKESIFTGLNNFKILSITDIRFDEQFGFTESEVKRLLDAYHLESHLPEMKEWYDGYHFGDADIYCPWDVINHVELLCKDSKAEPKCYWINSSGNSLVKRFITKANKTTRDEIVRLIHVGRNDDLTAGLAYAFQFTQCLIRLVQQVDHVRCDNCIKTPVRIGKVKDVSLLKQYITVFPVFLFRTFQHLCGKVGGDQAFAARRDHARQKPRAAGTFQHIVGGRD